MRAPLLAGLLLALAPATSAFAVTLADMKSSCEAGNGEDCALVGNIYAVGRQAPKDEAKARHYMKKACAARHPVGCYLLGDMLDKAGDAAGAVGAWSVACDAGKARACTAAALIFIKGRGAVPRDSRRAARFLERGCEAGDALTCFRLGQELRGGGDPPADPSRAAELFRRACDGGVARACGAYAVTLLTGRGVDKDPVQGLALLQKTCVGGDAESCDALAVCFERGIGTRPDRTRAGELYERACQAGYEKACPQSDRLGRGSP